MMGMSPSEVYVLELCEFYAIYDGWRRLRQQESRERWEQSRWMACAIIGPWLKGGKTMAELLPLPWDEKSKSAEVELEYDPEDMDARRRWVEKLIGMDNGNGQVSESAD